MGARESGDAAVAGSRGGRRLPLRPKERTPPRGPGCRWGRSIPVGSGRSRGSDCRLRRLEETCREDNAPAGRKSCKYGLEVARAVIEIGAEATSLLVASTEEGNLVPLLERRQALIAARLGARALTTVVESEVEIARRAGAESVQVLVDPELRGSHLLRGLERRLRPLGLGPIAAPTGTERAALVYRAALARLPEPAAGEAESRPAGGAAEVTVVEMGLKATTIAAGKRARGPSWWAARPLHSTRLMTAALRGDPPSLSERAVALDLTRRQLANLKPPRSRHALLVGSDAALVALACGEQVDAATCEEARSYFGGMLSEIGAAQLGIELSAGRRLPAALTVAQAVCELLDQPVRIVPAGPAEGVLLNDPREVDADESTHA